MVTRHNPAVPAFGVPSVSSALALLTAARKAPHATSQRAGSSPAACFLSSPGAHEVPHATRGVREAAQPPARKQDKREVLDDQITIRE